MDEAKIKDVIRRKRLAGMREFAKSAAVMAYGQYAGDIVDQSTDRECYDFLSPESRAVLGFKPHPKESTHASSE